ncbi:trihelix transcription factor ASR3-like [Punica granatum]|uniref:Myb-like domain-containing protein n=2 Tax=Punica granatum TaxID=22663 RepID=A0A218XZU9_PUNGR|nr:trihelix transcription factor ASR3-like [Punica granatum]OWM89812.1 hypothetical protein CDL15_Pgr024560 [Punica granatum]PKI57862.1 hypothetical protein CRG98_021765 [Punica granatum]
MEPEQQLSLGTAEGDGGGNGGDDSVKAARLPRWTRQEILVLIQGKRVAEGRLRGRRAGRAASGGGLVEPKWALVSSYCRRHGVNRGPLQCRKRWSNLSGDFKKIREWEARVRAGEAAESFWAMRNDMRRGRKLPGFFDREVFDILDHRAEVPAPPLALARAPAAAEEAEEVIFDSGRKVVAEDGLFSDFEQEQGGASSPRDEAEAEAEAEVAAIPTPIPLRISTRITGMLDENLTSAAPESKRRPEEGRKRKRPVAEAGDEETLGLQHRLIDLLEKNSRLLTDQLEVQDRNSKLDRDLRKDQADGLLGVLNKLADALVKIADRL